MSTQPTVSSGGAPIPPPADVGVYNATVGVSVVTSTFEQVQPLGPTLRGTLAAPPGYLPWPPPQLVPSVDMVELSDLQLLLFRLDALFSAGSRLAADSPDALSAAIDAEWPTLATARERFAGGTAVTSYRYVAVNAHVDVTGDMGWGYQPSGSGGSPLPIPDAVVQGRPEFDCVLQNLVRVDLLTRIQSTL